METNVGVLGTGLFFLALTIGRFSGGMILNWMKPKVFLVLTSVLSVLAIAGLFAGIKMVSVVCFFVIGLGFANMFPLIFSIAVDTMPQRGNELSGLMITAIAGGAIVPPIMGLVADHTSNLVGFVVPLLAVIYILWVSVMVLRQKVVAQAA